MPIDSIVSNITKIASNAPGIPTTKINSLREALSKCGYFEEVPFLPDDKIIIPRALPVAEQISHYLDKLG